MNNQERGFLRDKHLDNRKNPGPFQVEKAMFTVQSRRFQYVASAVKVLEGLIPASDKHFGCLQVDCYDSSLMGSEVYTIIVVTAAKDRLRLPSRSIIKRQIR